MTSPLPIHRFEEGTVARPVLEFGAGPSVPHVIHVDHVIRAEAVYYSGPHQDFAEMLRNHELVEFDRYVMHLPWEKNPIPSNGSHGSHYAHAAKVRAVRATAVALTRQMDPKLFVGPDGVSRCRLALEWHVVTQTKRDAPNLMLTLKALTDGIRDDVKRHQVGIVRDDTPDLVNALMPTIIYAPRSPDRPRAFFRLHVYPWNV